MTRSELERVIQVLENWVEGRDLEITLPILRRELERMNNRWSLGFSLHHPTCHGCLFFGRSPADPTDIGCNHGTWARQLLDAGDCPCRGRSYVPMADATSDDYDNWAFTGQPWSFSPAGVPGERGSCQGESSGSREPRGREVQRSGRRG
jgi:hypothetical protein